MPQAGSSLRGLNKGACKGQPIPGNSEMELRVLETAEDGDTEVRGGIKGRQRDRVSRRRQREKDRKIRTERPRFKEEKQCRPEASLSGLSVPQ